MDWDRVFAGMVLALILIVLYEGGKWWFEYRKSSSLSDDILEARAEFEKAYDYALPGDEGATEVLILNQKKPHGGHLKIHVWGRPKASTQFPEIM